MGDTSGPFSWDSLLAQPVHSGCAGKLPLLLPEVPPKKNGPWPGGGAPCPRVHPSLCPPAPDCPTGSAEASLPFSLLAPAPSHPHRGLPGSLSRELSPPHWLSGISDFLHQTSAQVSLLLQSESPRTRIGLSALCPLLEPRAGCHADGILASVLILFVGFKQQAVGPKGSPGSDSQTTWLCVGGRLGGIFCDENSHVPKGKVIGGLRTQGWGPQVMVGGRGLVKYQRAGGSPDLEQPP